MDPNFSEKELHLLRRYAHDRGTLNFVLLFLSVFAPSMCFAIFGLVRQDYWAVFIAFVGASLFLIWVFSNSVKNSATLRSISQKVLGLDQSK